MLYKPALLTALHSSFRLLLYDQVRITSDFHGDYNDFFCGKLRPCPALSSIADPHFLTGILV